MSEQPREVSTEPCHFLRVELKDGERYLLPYGSLISVHFVPESTTEKLDQIRLMFASHDVDIQGGKLDDLFESFESMKQRIIRESNATGAKFQGGITSINVKDKTETAKKKAARKED